MLFFMDNLYNFTVPFLRMSRKRIETPTSCPIDWATCILSIPCYSDPNRELWSPWIMFAYEELPRLGKNNNLPSLPTSNTHLRPSNVLSANIQWKGLNPSFIPFLLVLCWFYGSSDPAGSLHFGQNASLCCDTGKVHTEESNCWATLKISSYYSSSTPIVLRLN